MVKLKVLKVKIERSSKQRVGKSGYSTVNFTQRIGRRGTLTTTVHKLSSISFP